MSLNSIYKKSKHISGSEDYCDHILIFVDGISSIPAFYINLSSLSEESHNIDNSVKYDNISLYNNAKNCFQTYRIREINHIETFDFILLCFNKIANIIEVGFKHIIHFFCDLFMLMILFQDHYSINKKTVKIRGGYLK